MRFLLSGLSRAKAGGRPGWDPSSHTNRQRSILRVRHRGFQPQQRPGVLQQRYRCFTRGGRAIGQRAVTQRGRRPRPLPPAQTTTLPRELQLQHEVSHARLQLTGWGHRHCSRVWIGSHTAAVDKPSSLIHSGHLTGRHERHFSISGCPLYHNLSADECKVYTHTHTHLVIDFMTAWNKNRQRFSSSSSSNTF